MTGSSGAGWAASHLGWSRGLGILGAFDDRHGAGGIAEGAVRQGRCLGELRARHPGGQRRRWGTRRRSRRNGPATRCSAPSRCPSAGRDRSAACARPCCSATGRPCSGRRSPFRWPGRRISVPAARGSARWRPMRASMPAASGASRRDGIAGGTIAGAAVGLRSRGGPVRLDLSYSRIVARSGRRADRRQRACSPPACRWRFERRGGQGWPAQVDVLCCRSRLAGDPGDARGCDARPAAVPGRVWRGRGDGWRGVAGSGRGG